MGESLGRIKGDKKILGGRSGKRKSPWRSTKIEERKNRISIQRWKKEEKKEKKTEEEKKIWKNLEKLGERLQRRKKTRKKKQKIEEKG